MNVLSQILKIQQNIHEFNELFKEKFDILGDFEVNENIKNNDVRNLDLCKIVFKETSK
jgi:hypothetical protein